MALVEKSYKKGDTIFLQGEVGKVAYLLQKGRVELLAIRNQIPSRIAILEQGALFGELALIDGSARMATAKALEATKCSVIDKVFLAIKLAQLTRAQRELYDHMLEYVRTTPTLEERAKIKGGMAESHADVWMKTLRGSPLFEKLHTNDRFLTALGEMLATYVDRRLPR